MRRRARGGGAGRRRRRRRSTVRCSGTPKGAIALLAQERPLTDGPASINSRSRAHRQEACGGYGGGALGERKQIIKKKKIKNRRRRRRCASGWIEKSPAEEKLMGPVVKNNFIRNNRYRPYNARLLRARAGKNIIKRTEKIKKCIKDTDV